MIGVVLAVLAAVLLVPVAVHTDRPALRVVALAGVLVWLAVAVAAWPS